MALVAAALAACAGIGLREPLRVNLAGLNSLPGEGMEARFLAWIRVQNPNDVSITCSGLSAELELNGKSFASGVSAATGEIPRFGESVVELPLTVPATAIVRQVLGSWGVISAKPPIGSADFSAPASSDGRLSTRPARSICPR